MKAKNRSYSCNPSCFGALSILSLCEVAQHNEMEVIAAWKPNMTCWHSIGLSGTAEAMKKTWAIWKACGNVPPKPHQMKSQFHVSLDTPKEKWVNDIVWDRIRIAGAMSIEALRAAYEAEKNAAEAKRA